MEVVSKSNNPVVGVLIYSLSGGGAERFASYLLPYLDDNNVRVKLFLMNTEEGYSIPDHIPIKYLEKSSPAENGFWKLLKIPFLAYRFSKLAKKEKLSYSFSLLTRPNYINILSKVWFRNSAKIIISERSFPSLQYGKNDFRSKINKRLISKLFPKADKVICNSQRTSLDLSDNFNIPLKKIKVIHNPIDLDRIKGIKGIEEYYDNSYFNLITVGRLVSGKNHKMLITAIKKLSNVRLYIIGDGELKANLKLQIENQELTNRVFLLGFESNPYQFLKNTDAFIFGSQYEGFPNVLLEAMACGLPIISTNCKSGPDEIMQLKVASNKNIMLTDYGILVPLGRPDLMTAAIEHFLENPDYLKKAKLKIKERVYDFKLDNILSQYKTEILR